MAEETFVERLKRENSGRVSLNPKLVEREKQTQLGYLVRLRVRLGHEITEAEWRALGNIL